MDTKNLVGVVTGGASGLGAACVRNLTEKGAKVCILDLDEEKAVKLTSEIGKSAIFCMCDVTDERSVQAAIDQTVQVFGAIQVAVNCAGFAITRNVLGEEGVTSMEHFNKAVQINLMGTMNVIRLTTEKMVKNIPNEDGERGVVINTASISALEGLDGQVAYSASKAGVVGTILPLAREFGRYGIRVMAIAPGLFDTPMSARMPENVRKLILRSIPFPQRSGRPIEFARLVQHIIENPMLNGEVIRLDGALRNTFFRP